MTDPQAIPVSDVVPHILYWALVWDPSDPISAHGDSQGYLGAAEIAVGAERPNAEFSSTLVELPPWPYFVMVQKLFSSEGRRVIEAHLLPDDRVGFMEFPVTLADGSPEHVHLAVPTERIDVLSPRSQVDSWGIARRWALELSKLRRRSFFGVPEAPGTTVVRGETLLALAELGGEYIVHELRVVDGDRRVDYAEWAEHPEWTTP